MKKIYLALFFLSLFYFSQAQQKLLQPQEFLGYALGDRFSSHYRVVEYFKHVAEVMPNVVVRQYGETYEHRPLIYTIVSAPENIKNIEQLRLDNLRRAGMTDGTPSMNKVAIVWLSYNVHGNEASSLEAAMWTLYELANPANTKIQEWLKNVVVIMDPCVNPDGRDRYANFYNQYFNIPANASGDAKEHHEPWPGGRANHYLFDLNRDWAWQTQIESQHRLKIYHAWMPHVHVDFHEQGYNSPYFFAPAAEPYHEVITPWQREFQTTIGKNHTRYFDAQGWLYFTKEVFDLYYPSYGDTYPTYNGAIGMTYEQGGGGFGGLAITTKEGDPLTLRDRVTHHHTTGLSTIEISAQHAGRIVDEFGKYFSENRNSPVGVYKSYVLSADNNADKLHQLLQWMDSHGIQYGHPASRKTVRGFQYQTQTSASFALSSEDIVFNTYQPKSRFITAVFEPQSKLPDSLTYDITAWNLIYAYDLKAYAVSERINIGKPVNRNGADNGGVSASAYAYLFRYQSLKDVSFLAALLRKGVRVRFAAKAFTAGAEHFDPGTLVITRRNNERITDFDTVVRQIADEMGRKAYPSATGFVEEGKDMGSGEVNFLKAPKIAVIFGDQTSSLNAGEIWHFFEQQLHYPITQIGTDYFKGIDLSQYDVLIVPEGRYTLFSESILDQISSWVTDGGKLIVIGGGLHAFAEKKGFSLKPYTTDKEKTEAEKREKELREKDILAHYAEAERKLISDALFGAIYSVTLDKSHPLAFGLRETYYSLKTSESRFGYLENGWNVGVIKGKAKPVQGFAGYKVNQRMSNSLVFGVEEKGRGNIVYLVDNPLFRSFWESGKMIFANAVFMVGQQ